MREANNLARPIRTTLLGTTALGTVFSIAAPFAVKKGVLQFIGMGIFYSFVLTTLAVGLQLNKSLWRRWFLITTSVLMAVANLGVFAVVLKPKWFAMVGPQHVQALSIFLFSWLGMGGLIALAGWVAHFRKYETDPAIDHDRFDEEQNSL